MPNLPPYAPPKTLLPITAEAYVGLAAMIDTAIKALELNDQRVAEGCKSGCMPKTKPRIGAMAATLYLYLPPELVPIEAAVLPPGMAPPTEEADRASHYTFRVGREALMAALDQMTPAEVRAELGDTSGALDQGAKGGIGWWAVALAAGGALYFLASRNFYVAAGTRLLPVAVRLSRAVAVLLVTAFAAKAISEVPEGAKWVWKEGVKPLIEPAGRALGWAAGLFGVAAGTVLVYRLATRPKKPRWTASVTDRHGTRTANSLTYKP